MNNNDLPELTIQQNAFVFHLFTDCIADRAKAYKLSYDCKNSSEKTIYEEASKLLKHPKITPWIKHYEQSLQDFQENEIRYTRQDFFNELDRIRAKTEDDKKTVGIALKAVELKGKTSGHLKDKVEFEGKTTVQMGDVTLDGQALNFRVGNNNNDNTNSRDAEYTAENAPDDNGV